MYVYRKTMAIGHGKNKKNGCYKNTCELSENENRKTPMVKTEAGKSIAR